MSAETGSISSDTTPQRPDDSAAVSEDGTGTYRLCSMHRFPQSRRSAKVGLRDSRFGKIIRRTKHALQIGLGVGVGFDIDSRTTPNRVFDLLFDGTGHQVFSSSNRRYSAPAPMCRTSPGRNHDAPLHGIPAVPPISPLHIVLSISSAPAGSRCTFPQPARKSALFVGET